MKINAEHKMVYSCPPENLFGYFGWPTAAKLTTGKLVIGASGFRNWHICPFGRTTLFESNDDGKTWSAPQIIQNSLIDDRDVGIVPLDDGELLLTWFRSDTRIYMAYANLRRGIDFTAVTSAWSDDAVNLEVGSWCRHRDKNGKWGSPRRLPVSSPHGPVRLSSGRLFHLGTKFDGGMKSFEDHILGAASSDDNGRTWTAHQVPKLDDPSALLCEPTITELHDGSLLALVRVQWDDPKRHFAIYRSCSTDGGDSWSPLEFFHNGAPPHVLRHSSGALICSFGWRIEPFGERAIVSLDDGHTWSEDLVLRDDGPCGDLGYPSTVELSDGSLCTVYYQAPDQNNPNNAIWATYWRLPEF